MNYNLEICYLDIYSKKISQLGDELLSLQSGADISVDPVQAQRFVQEIDRLKRIVENLPVTQK